LLEQSRGKVRREPTLVDQAETLEHVEGAIVVQAIEVDDAEHRWQCPHCRPGAGETQFFGVRDEQADVARGALTRGDAHGCSDAARVVESTGRAVVHPAEYEN